MGLGDQTKVGKEEIGKKGITKGESSDAGGQYSHMPAASSYTGRLNDGAKGGKSGGTTKSPYPFLPAKPESK